MMFSMSGQNKARGRAAKRIKLFQPATLVREGASMRIHLLDISKSGALAHAEAPPAAHASVRVECEGLVRTASVRWSERKRFGLLFDRPLLASEVERLLPPAPAALARAALA